MKTHAACILAAILLGIPQSATRAQPYGLDIRSPVQPFLNNRLPPDQPDAGKYAVVPAFPNLGFQNPVGLIPEPGSTRLCVLTREGRIFAFENDPTVSEKSLFLDISARTQGWDDSGLLGMAFHPEFGQPNSTNRGFVYVFYQYSSTPTSGPDRPPEKTAAHNRLSRFTVPDGARSADPDSELVLINQYDRSVWHNGGAMFFHPDDGFLYLTVGDEGGVDGEFGNAQRIDRGLFSGVIRIDVNQDPKKSHPIRRQPISSPQGATRSANYFIPNDNPFQNPSGAALEEFWCIGLRSPHRMTFDPVSKSIWEGDVGQGAREEINLIEKGGNYQWAYKEGNLNGPFPKPAAPLGKEMAPIHEYPHTKGESQFDGDNCVIGGYVYRGREFADELGAKYIFGDNGSGRIWALTLAADRSVSVAQIATMPPGFNYSGLSSFGIDHNRELYLCQMGAAGKIFKLARPKPSSPPPPLLSQTGAFASLAKLEPAPSLIPYTVNSPLWSDAALKTRWMALPNDGAPYGADERVSFAASGEWAFPLGTVFVKHFDLAIDEADPSKKKRLETRFLVRDTKGGVYGITYKWRSDNSDADLLSASLSEHLSVSLSHPVAPFSNTQDIGSAIATGSTRYDPTDGSYTITAFGSQMAQTTDQFHFAHQSQSGDFDVKVRIESMESARGGAFVGLMARESVAADSRYILLSLTTTRAEGYAVLSRERPGESTVTIDLKSPAFPQFPNAWLRLRRIADRFTAYAGDDGVSWNQLADVTLPLPGLVQLGLTVNALGQGARAIARFSGLANNRAQTWYYPSPRDCVTCHTPFANHVLGVKTSQLNGLFTYPATGRTDNQLRAWNHLELFQPSPDESQIPALPKLVAVTDTAAPLERRVRSYLAANCAQCHRPGGVRANFDARYETPLPRQNLVNGPLFELLGISGARVVSPGDLSKSILFRRISALGDNQMPPLARNTIDNAAVAVVTAWINSLPPVSTARGLRGEYFDNIDLTDPKLTRIDQTVNFDWKEGSPASALGPDSFSARWTGEIEPTFSETYTFYTTSDDGVRLWIDGRLIIDNWTDHAPTENNGTIDLQAGRKYNLRLEYFENAGGALLRLAWSSPSQLKQIIPSTRLGTPIDPTFQLPPPLLRLEPLANGQMRLIIDAEIVGNYSVEATRDFGQWTELRNFPNRIGTFDFIDSATTNFPHRFYRAVGPDR